MKRILFPVLLTIVLTSTPGRVVRAQELRPDPVDRLLDHLQQRDPDQAQHLRTLRAEDPQAFRRALRERLQEARQRMESGDPDRDPRERRRGAEGEEEERARARHMPPTPPGEPEIRRVDATIRDLLLQVNTAATAEQRESLHRDLHAAVAARFDLIEEARRVHLGHLEQGVEQLRHLLEERATQREELIQERVKSLLQRSSQPPAPPAPRRGSDRLNPSRPRSSTP
jgi:hypothetical protein